MSRIGRLPVTIPAKVDVKISGANIAVKGPKGELQREMHPLSSAKIDGSTVLIERQNDARDSRSVHGLTRALVANMVKGVSEGFQRKLEINGVGYKVEAIPKSRFLRFDLGFSHPILYELPQGITAETDKNNNIVLSGIDRELLGSAAAKIRSFRAPEPYKGKGVKYAEEHIKRKVGKAGGR